MVYLIPIAVLSLFTAFKIMLGGGAGQLRPFDAFVLVMTLFMLFETKLRIPKRWPTGFLALLPFFIWHVVSAASVGFENGLREAIQTVLLTVFAYILAVYSKNIDYVKFGRILIAGMLIITAYNIYWHLDQGFVSGWKRLNDPKRVFSLLPVVVGCMIILSGRSLRPRLWLLWALIGVLIVFSGERKALFIYLIIWGTLVTQGRLLIAIPAVSIGVMLLALLASVAESTYLARQFGSILDPLGSIVPVEAIASGEVPKSISNAQRVFAFDMSTHLFWQHPLFGVGTNRYVDIINARFAHLPAYLRLSPHGEFLRVLVENGLLGLTLYLFIWSSALIRVRRKLATLVRQSAIRLRQAKALLIVLFVPSFIYVGLEASGTYSTVILIVISLLPSFLGPALLGRQPNRTTGHTTSVPPNGPRAIPSTGMRRAYRTW